MAACITFQFKLPLQKVCTFKDRIFYKPSLNGSYVVPTSEVHTAAMFGLLLTVENVSEREALNA
jgi:hypothetical protein